MAGMIKRVDDIQYHRNGICGTGFHTVLFEDSEGRDMMATVFEAAMHTAVVLRRRAGDGDLTTHWRGDHFDDELRAVIAAWDNRPYDLNASDFARAAEQSEHAFLRQWNETHGA